MGKGAAAVAQWMSNPNRFADFFNGNVFCGEQKVHPKELEPAKGESHILIEDKERKKAEIHRYRDVTMQWKSQGQNMSLAILACENQDKIHWGMPVRNMMYDSLAYQEQMRILWNHLNKDEKKECTQEEYLSRHREKDKLVPIITLVLYYGEKTWSANKDLYEMLNMDILEKEYPELVKYVQNYQINLVDVMRMENFDIFHTDLQQVFGMLKYKGDKKELDKYIRQNPEYFENLDKETGLVIAELLNSESILKNAEKIQEGEKMSMCKALEDLYNEGKEEGKEHGEERFANLTRLLLDNDRLTDLKRATSDAEFRKMLFEEFGI